MSNYNGWTNYATWRVNLEIFDGIDPYWQGWFSDTENSPDLADVLKEYANEILDQSGEGLALDYARAFLSDVNWHEIAENMIEAYQNDEAA